MMDGIMTSAAILVVLVFNTFWLYFRTKKANRILDRQIKETSASRKNLELLVEIGKKITSTFDMDKITMTVYQNVNSLMDASVFAICIVNQKTNSLDYINPIEKGKINECPSLSLDDKSRIGVICAIENREIIINDYELEYSKYVDKITVAFGEA